MDRGNYWLCTGIKAALCFLHPQICILTRETLLTQNGVKLTSLSVFMVFAYNLCIYAHFHGFEIEKKACTLTYESGTGYNIGIQCSV